MEQRPAGDAMDDQEHKQRGRWSQRRKVGGGARTGNCGEVFFFFSFLFLNCGVRGDDGNEILIPLPFTFILFLFFLFL